MDKCSCSARRHLRGADFSVYDAARQLTARSRQNSEPAICNASRETLAAMTSYCERTITECRQRLVAAGWWKPVRPAWVEDQRRTGKAGQFSTPEFIVVEHDEWAAAHPGLCGTVSTFTAHGQTASGGTVDGKTASTVHGRAADTAHGKPTHKALCIKPEKEKPDTLCSLRCAGGWQFIEMPKAGSSKFVAIFDEAFLAYRDESSMCAEQSKCSCDRAAFLETVLDACRTRRVRYPSGLLTLKKRLDRRAS